jgi:hypothetical protein
MKLHKEIADSTWFTLFGDKILTLVIFTVLAPSFWALRLIHSNTIWLGAVVLTVWALIYGWILWALHRHNHLRLLVSLPCTALALLAAFLFVWGV